MRKGGGEGEVDRVGKEVRKGKCKIEKELVKKIESLEQRVCLGRNGNG